ncbi:hypothetical protein RZS08_60475, partial [Arthrospira platensis SPKY1]|nr:hypothetical protein [Arthrospira platensis SPKY1]
LIASLLELHPQRELPLTLHTQLTSELTRLETIQTLVRFYKENLRSQNRASKDHWRFLLLRNRDTGNDYLGTFIYESSVGMIVAQVTEQQIFEKLQPLLIQPA